MRYGHLSVVMWLMASRMGIAAEIGPDKLSGANVDCVRAASLLLQNDLGTAGLSDGNRVDNQVRGIRLLARKRLADGMASGGCLCRLCTRARPVSC